MKYFLILLILTLAASGAVKPSNTKFLKPEEAIAKMDIPKGFQVTNFVSEPHINEAIAFCFDQRGRLWTLENRNYVNRRSHTTESGKNRIQIFEDTDGDGKFDKKKTFIEGLRFSSGIAVGHGGVYVGAPPELIFIPDADLDDKPDGKPEVLLDGWGTNDRHETLNSFIWGPDGWLYGCHGVFTRSKVGKPGAQESERKYIDGGIWRFHPVRKEFEVFAEGLSNPWGFDFNDMGEGFATCCVIPHLFHIIQGGIYDKQSRANVNPYVYDNIKTIRDHKHKSAHGGARFYLADVFPEKYRNHLFMCNIHQHEVLTDIMMPKGSGYVGVHGKNFLPTNDLAWVGFSVEVGPDGGVYILDWHDQDICGNSVRFPNSGRVYRIFPEGLKAPKTPDLNKMSDIELVKLQMHSNDWYVRHARVLLHERAAKGDLDKSAVHESLRSMLKAAPNTGKRLRALWALHVTGGLNPIETLKHEDDMVRAWSVQLLCEEGKPSPEALAAFAKMAKSDESPKVRLYLASGMQRLPSEKRWEVLEALSSHVEDVKDHNIPKMIWLALEPMVPTHQEKALKLAVKSKMPLLQEFVPRRMLAGIKVTKESANKPVHRFMEKIAPGFKLRSNDYGESGKMTSFRNKPVFQTHPINKNTPAVLFRKVTVKKGKKTFLKLSVSHLPHYDWQLRVKVDKKIIENTLVSSKTVKDGWLEKSIDLTAYAGRTIKLELENAPNNWSYEHAIWSSLRIVEK